MDKALSAVTVGNENAKAHKRVQSKLTLGFLLPYKTSKGSLLILICYRVKILIN